MNAAVFVEPGRIVVEDKSVPQIGPLDALVKITTTTICGTDIHILKRKPLWPASLPNSAKASPCEPCPQPLRKQRN
jgi:threonine dehydrogenase-like Zn-dependent dehydrogenase